MSKKFKIGIDYGGTKIEGILLDEFGKIIERKRVNYKKNYQSSLHAVLKLIKDLENLTKSQCTVGIGIPGFSSKETGLINNSNASLSIVCFLYKFCALWAKIILSL